MKVNKIIFTILLLAIATCYGQFEQTTDDDTSSIFVFPPNRPTSDFNPVLGPLSLQCKRTLFNVLTSQEFAKCIPLESLSPIMELLPLMADPDIMEKVMTNITKYIKPFIKAFDEFSLLICNAPKCNNESLADMIEVVKYGCETDLNENQFLQVIYEVIVFYPLIIDIFCIEDEQKPQFCWAQTILKIINLPSSPFNIGDNQIINSIAFADPLEICSACSKKIFTTIFNFINNNDLALQVLESHGVVIDIIKEAVAIKCGLTSVLG